MLCGAIFFGHCDSVTDRVRLEGDPGGPLFTDMVSGSATDSTDAAVPVDFDDDSSPAACSPFSCGGATSVASRGAALFEDPSTDAFPCGIATVAGAPWARTLETALDDASGGAALFEDPSTDAFSMGMPPELVHLGPEN